MGRRLRIGANSGGSGNAQWLSDIAAAGVLRSFKFSSLSDVTPHISDDTPPGNIVFSNSVSAPSGGGWAKINVKDLDGTSNGALHLYIAADQRVFGPAQAYKEYYARWCEREPAEMAFAVFPGNGSNAPKANGNKHAIFSSYAESNPSGSNAFVIEDTENMGCPRAYYYNGSSPQGTEIPLDGTRNRLQPAINNGGSESTNNEIEAKYGPVYPITPINSGTPSAHNGGTVNQADVVVTHLVRVKFGASFADTLIEAWRAVGNAAPVKWLERVGLTFGTANGGHDGWWATTYCTGRTSNGGFDTYRLIGDIIHSLSKIKINGFDVTPVSELRKTTLLTAEGAFGITTIGNQINADPNGTLDSLFSYSPRLLRDPVNKTICHFGGNHGNAGTFQRLWLTIYDEATNLMVPAPVPIAVPGGSTSQVTHGFNGGCVDPENGNFYCILPYIDQTIIHRYRPSTGTWDTPFPVLSSGVVDHNSCAVLEVHPNLYGGQRGLIFGNANGVWTINLTTLAAWANIFDRSNAVDAMSDGGFGLACYCRKDNTVYMGGGNNSTFGGEVPLMAIPASAGAGSTSYIAASPVPLSSSNDSSSVGFISDSGKIEHGMVCICRDGRAWEFNGSTWTALGSVLPGSITGAYNRWMTAGAIYDHGCIAFWLGTNDLKSSTAMYSWDY